MLVEPAADGSLVVYQGGTPATDVLIELRRVLGRAYRPEPLTAEAFQLRLSRAYQRDNSEAEQMAEDISADVDLSRLAEEIPDRR